VNRLVIFFAVAITVPAQTVPKVSNVLNGASFGTHLSPGTLASLFGSDLATSTVSAKSMPIETELAGTKVLVQDPSMPGPISAPLYFVSPGQINFQIPFEVVRSIITITISTSQGTSAPYTINLEPIAPGIFSQTANGTGDALVFDSNFKLLTRTPDPGTTIIFYANGLGSTLPAAKSGSGGSSTVPFNVVASPFEVYIGGTKATVAWAGLAPGFAGVYQLNVVPLGAAIGDIVITCANCSESNHVHMPQAPLNSGNNTSNVSGSVSIVYPTGQPTITFSSAFVVVKITARFDLKPKADRFTLSAVARIGSTSVDGTTIQFDPVSGHFTASVPAPSPAVRNLDFSQYAQTGFLILDFLCGAKGCPVPGNIIPLSRFDPTLLSLVRTVPLPNVSPTGIHSFYSVTGHATPGATFSIDANGNLDLSFFGSIGIIPYPTTDVPVSVVLYVDGQIIDATMTTYKRP
jgi:uncharacterized protein (TIGR03437 family)